MGKFGLVSCDLIYGVNLDMTSLHLRLVRLQRLVLLGICKFKQEGSVK